MLVEIPPKYSISQIMGYLKGKSSLIIFDRYANLKYKYGNRNFRCRVYYVDTVGRNEKKIKEYIQNQLKEDYYTDQISIKEYYDPFTGESVKTNKKTASAVVGIVVHVMEYSTAPIGACRYSRLIVAVQTT